jgi:hypothetical protein
VKGCSLILLLAVLACGAVCQQAPPTQPGTKQAEQLLAPEKDWRVTWRNATVAFGQVGEDALTKQKFFSAVGTGVLITPGSNSAMGYLVTARHVFCEPEKKWFPLSLNVRFAWEDHKSIYSYVGIPMPLRAGEKPLWATLDDDTDIAVLPFPALEVYNALPPDDRKSVVQTVGISSLSTEVYAGEPVLIFGYPALAGNDRLVRAFLRQGVVAWTNPTNADAPFMIDANLFEGNSGGPVVRFPFGLLANGTWSYMGNGDVSLLGIVSQVMMEDVRSTTSVPAVGKIETHTQISGVGALGVIEPTSKILKLINAMQEGKTKTPVCPVK